MNQAKWWVLWVMLAGGAQAADNTTQQEIAMLPAYCDAKIGRQNPVDVERWRAQMNHENWIHMHHYCSGLIELNRYYRAARGKQQPNLGNAVNEFTGMINGWRPGFYLIPEAYLNRGRAYRLMRHDGRALADFIKALELDPGLTQASVELSDVYKAAGKKQEALDVLKRALERKPDSKVLKRRYTALGGNPDSLVRAAPDTPAPPAAATPEVPTPPAPALDVTAPAQASSDAAPAPKPPVQLIEPKIGSPKNPYCRFCPD